MTVKTLWIKTLAVIVAMMFMAASGWAAEPQKAAAKGAPAPDKKVEKKDDKKPAKGAELLDLNSATKEQLMALPGIGAETAQQIIKNRPYAKKDQLKSMKILTDQGYDKIKDRVIAKQPPKKQTQKKK